MFNARTDDTQTRCAARIRVNIHAPSQSGAPAEWGHLKTEQPQLAAGLPLGQQSSTRRRRDKLLSLPS